MATNHLVTLELIMKGHFTHSKLKLLLQILNHSTLLVDSELEKVRIVNRYLHRMCVLLLLQLNTEESANILRNHKYTAKYM